MHCQHEATLVDRTTDDVCVREIESRHAFITARDDYEATLSGTCCFGHFPAPPTSPMSSWACRCALPDWLSRQPPACPALPGRCPHLGCGSGGRAA